jgi:hypothetical protein
MTYLSTIATACCQVVNLIARMPELTDMVNGIMPRGGRTRYYRQPPAVAMWFPAGTAL